jgi:hypothetical protein
MRWREDALDFEAGGVGSVFEEVDAGMGCEVAEFFRAPWRLDGEVERFRKDGLLGGGLDAGKERQGGGLAIGGEDALEGNEGGWAEIVGGEGVSLFGAPAVEEVGFQLRGETGDEAALTVEAGEDFQGEFSARDEVEGLVEEVNLTVRGNLFRADDPVEIEAVGPGEFLGERRQPGGVVTGGSAFHAGEAMDGEICGEDDAHVA